VTSPTEEVGARLRLRDRAQFQRDAQGAAKDIKNIGDSADKAESSGKRMGSGMGVARAGIGGLTSAARVGITAIAGLTVVVGGLAAKTVGLAMDAAETQSKFNTVFAGMEADVGSFVTQMNADYGIPTKELQDAASSFGIFAKAAGIPSENLAGFSKDLTAAGMDLASFYNVEPGEAFQALSSGLSGEAEPLRRFGIFLSDATMKAEAASMGLKGELTEQQKVMLRQRIIMKSLGDAQGDLARTSGGLSNQWKALKGRLTEAGTAIGTALLPYANQLVVALNDRLQPAVAWLQDNLPGMVQGAAESLTAAGERAKAAWEWGTYGDVGAAFLGMPALVDPINRVADAAGDLWTIFTVGIVPAFATVQAAIPGLQSPLDTLDSTLDFLADNAETLHPLLVGLVAVWTAWRLAVVAHNVVMAVAGGLAAARVGLNMLVTGSTGLATAAELTRNQAIIASIALHARLGAMMIWTGIKAVASMVLAVATTVGGWIVMGATAMVNAGIMAVAWVVALGPIGWGIALLVLLGGAFVILWKKSETFRNIVKGSLAAVGSAAIAAKDWIVGAFNTTVGFLSGLPARIRVATSGMWDGIKSSFRSAINFIIDGWNGLSFSIPGIDPPGPGPTIPGFSIGTPNIPRLHQGGSTTSAGSVIIQPDEELVVLPPAASVVPLDNAPAVAAATGGSSGPITLQVVLDRRVLAEAVYDHTGDKVARR